MKANFLFAAVLMLMMVGLFSSSSVAQNPTYTCTLANDVVTSGNVLEFDIYLLRTGGTPFELAQFQGGFTFNNAIKGAGTLTASWVPGSNDPALVTSGQINTLNAASTSAAGVIRIAPKLAAGGAGSGAIISNVAPGTRIGRLRLTNSVPFVIAPANVLWNFSIVSPNYPTKVFAYVGINTDVTVQGGHLNNLANDPVPVELSSFTASSQDRNVNLSWATKTEVNTSMFQIERTVQNTQSWIKVGEVSASGNSNSTKEYSFTDKKLNSGKYIYRLKMIDADGTF